MTLASLYLHNIKFELRERVLRRGFAFAVLSMFVLGALVAFVSAKAQSGAASPGALSTGYAVTALTLGVLFAAIFPIVLSAAESVRRDHDARMAELIHATPAPDWLILLSRFTAQVLIATAIVVAAQIGYEVGCRMPWIASGLAGPAAWTSYASALVGLALPTIAALSAITMCVAAATGNRLAYWLLPLAVWVIEPVSGMAAAKGLTILAVLMDPFGFTAWQMMTETLPRAEQVAYHVPLAGPVLWNRVFWLLVGVGSLSLAAAVVSRRAGTIWMPWLWSTRRRRASAASQSTQDKPVLGPAAAATINEGPPVIRLTLAPGNVPPLAIYWARSLFELSWILRSVTSIVLLLFPVFAAMLTLALRALTQFDHQPLLPVTATVVPKLAGAGFLIPLLALVLAGEMTWRERQAGIHEIVETAAIPPFTMLGAKMTALAIITGAQFAALSVVGIVWQVMHGAPQINLGQYAAVLFVEGWTGTLMGAALAMFVHAMVPHRIAGHLLTFGLLVLLSLPAGFGFEHKLLSFGAVPSIELSDMNGLGHYLGPALWFVALWSFVSAVLFLLAELVRDRGLHIPIMLRLRVLKSLPLEAQQALAFAGVGIVTIAGFIFWNTNIRNTYESSGASERRQMAYEQTFGPHVAKPQPQVSGLDLVVDLYPAQRAFRVKGEMTLRNHTSSPISAFYVESSSPALKLAMPGSVSIRQASTCCRPLEVTLSSPLLPGQDIKLEFEDERSARGKLMGDELGVHENGTRLDAYDVVPVIGVHHRFFLANDARREALGLPRLKDATGGEGSLTRSFNSPDSSGMLFAITLSTSADQTAVAPGKLVKRWQTDGRNYFRYEIGTPVESRWTILSARYNTVEDGWRGLPLYVHHHPAHASNVSRMIEGMKLALDYCSEAFSPYQFQELRLAEYPYAGEIAATAQPALIAYSEMAGFIADGRNASADDAQIIDVTAHEVAHQWWAYQIVPADRPGAKFLSESLAEYTSLMVRRKRIGAARVRRTVADGAERYLKARSTLVEEQPLVNLNAFTDPALYYAKGSAALYALMENVGEANMNRALTRFVREYAGKTNPYPTALDLVATFKAELDHRHHTLIQDLFERITLWSFELMSAKTEQQPDGSWRTTLALGAKKVEADAKGAETERPLDQRIPLVVTTEADGPKARSRSETVYVTVRSGGQSVSFSTKGQPKSVRINASRALFQRDVAKTTVQVAR